MESIRQDLSLNQKSFSFLDIIGQTPSYFLTPLLRLPHRTAPSTPVNGDIWTTPAGLFVRINGVTIGPLA
jgi:hypothetical protein